MSVSRDPTEEQLYFPIGELYKPALGDTYKKYFVIYLLWRNILFISSESPLDSGVCVGGRGVVFDCICNKSI